MGTFQKFCLRWNNHTTNLLGTLGHILTSEQHSDVTLCCQGEVWRLHKLVLCASSSHFEKLLAGLPPSTAPIVVLDGPHPHDVASLIHFIYHGEVNVDQENLASLLRTAESLKIKGLAEVSSVTSGGEHKIQTDGNSHRDHCRGQTRPNSSQSTPLYTQGSDYPLGMYGFIPSSVSPHTHVPDPHERDPSPLNLSFSGTLKNIHDETPQERQERRNRLDDLLYAATERSKKDERREARREAREAALREASAVRDASGGREVSSVHETSTTSTQEPSSLPPPPKRPRTIDPTRATNFPTHPPFHIPLVNLTLPSSASVSVSHSVSSTQVSQPSHVVPLVDQAAAVIQKQDIQNDQLKYEDAERTPTKSPCKSEKVEASSFSSEGNSIEEVTVNSDESDTQSAPETPSESRTTQVTAPTTTTVATQASDGVSLLSSCLPSVSASVNLPSSVNAPPSSTDGSSQVQPSDISEEKVTPYYHSILQQVAEGNTSGEATSANSQRVTINMRTFKEEWRRQLLVDYDTRTNMSICMLCFTTFKSYDGPRKNTYVKHAKRFHPSLEEYSEQERDLIINMYEKYHKYDVDMQKEVNKSYRAANAFVALGKKGSKHCEVNTEVTCTADLQVKVTAELEATDENKEGVTEGNHLKEEELTFNSGKSRSHTPESDVSSEVTEKIHESAEVGFTREKLENNNISTAAHTKRSHMNTRAKSAASTTTVVV